MIIWEPTTTITDYMLTAVSLIFFFLLRRNHQFSTQSSIKLWAFGFLTAGLAAAAGGTFHGFGPYFPEVGKRLWNGTVLLLGSCSAFMVAGTLAAGIDRRSPTAKLLLMGLAISIAGLILLGSGVGLHQHFNHNDLYHCVQMVAFYFFYRGARLLKDRSHTH